MAIKTYQQGGLDGLCGVYAVVNALRHLLQVRTPEEFDQDIFRVVLEAIPQREYPKVLLEGMASDRLFTTAKRAAKHMRSKDFDVSVERPFVGRAFRSAATFLDAVDEICASDYAAVILGIEWVGDEDTGHWSVYRDREGGKLRFRDSDGLRPLSLRTLTLTDTRSHRLCPEETLVFRLHGCDGETFD